MRYVLLAASLYVVGANAFSQSPPGRVAVRLPSAVGDATCASPDGRAVASQGQGVLLFNCSRPSGLVGCDFSNAEPVDLPLDTVCRTATIPTIAAASVVISARSKTPVTVEWLKLASDGAWSTLATRQMTIVRGLTLRVSTGPQRFVRFSRSGYSPVTVGAEDLAAASGWTLPDPKPGGELLTQVEPGIVLPEVYRLAGPRTGEIRVDDRVLIRSGLPAGRYTMTPVYSGGIAGAGRAVTIADGQSTLVFSPAEAVGALRISAEGPVCAHANELALVHRTRNAAMLVARFGTEGGCSRSVGGLRPGQYEVSLMSSGSHVTTGRVNVGAQTLSTVHLEAAPVRLYGRVTVNDEISNEITMDFLRGSSALAPRTTIKVRPNGWYDAPLPAPGTFDVVFSLHGKRLLGQDETIEVPDGETRRDWNLMAGTLEVRFQGWDYSPRLMVTLNRLDMKEGGLASSMVTVTPDDLPFEWQGLALGRYAVEARQRIPFARDKLAGAVVTLDSAHRDRSVVLNLTERRVVASVVDASGAPVSGAFVRTDLRSPTALEIGPGQYELENLLPGTEVLVSAPGFATGCWRVREESEMTVVLRRGTPALVALSEHQPRSSSLPGRLMSEGWDCPVPLMAFQIREVVRSEPGRRLYRIADFPTSPQTYFGIGSASDPGRWQKVAIGPDGVIELDVGRRDE